MWYCRKCKEIYSKIYKVRRHTVYNEQERAFITYSDRVNDIEKYDDMEDWMLECGHNGVSNNIIPLFYNDVIKESKELVKHFKLSKKELELLRSKYLDKREYLKGLVLLNKLNKR